MSQTPAPIRPTAVAAVGTTANPPSNLAPAWSARRPVTIGLITVALLVFGFGGWSLTTEIDGAIVANGQLEVEKNKQIVNHPDGGVVAEIAVKEAQAVKAGDLLIRLDGSLLNSELAIVEGQSRSAYVRDYIKAMLEEPEDDDD